MTLNSMKGIYLSGMISCLDSATTLLGNWGQADFAYKDDAANAAN